MQLKIKLVKSLIGSKVSQKATVKSLGLTKIGQEVIQPKNVATEGKIKKISHLIQVSKV